ncbi:acyl-CoA dehydrogenase family protein [Kineobactrum salinum]|uniref:Acyl-CoA dehydrogenase family protein n=1 Tax=Kineobactrum salinum TaxID=2708301 RepID=A0A6C0U213_9GAMM|nr:acyl-CoA dehydrogenase family protein [Kineobactrum salinum]QIB65027.1 acyl-CoA dehydrogenase family protein [Kineobactrum salinum]
MALVLTEEQLMLRDSAAGLLAEKAGVAQLRALRDTGDELGFSRQVWREIAELGWPGIAIPEEYGGLGYGYAGLGLVLEQVGRNLSPTPLQASVLVGATAVNELGSESQKQMLLPALAAGEQLVSLALQEGAHHAPEHTAMTARADGEGFVLNGTKCLVLDALAADWFVVIARSAGEPGDTAGLSAFLVPAASTGLTLEARSLVDSRGVAALRFSDVRLGADAVMATPGQAWDGLSHCLDIVNIGLASELLGLATEAFERTVAFLQERKQFGRVIGSFQGLQHRAAELFAELELARSIVLRALQAIDDRDPDLPRLASAAKAKLCEVAQRATNEAIQMHGGVGMTDEFDIGFFLKRARVAQHSFGDYNYHLDRFARLGGF